MLNQIISIEINEEALKPLFKAKTKSRKTRGRGQVIHTAQKESHSADYLRSENDINSVVLELLTTNQISKAALLTFGVNTGYRCSDMLSFKVSDIIGFDGKCLEEINISEDKTDKSRLVYLNNAVRTAVETLVTKRELKYTDYLFGNDGNRKAYIIGYKYNDKCEVDGFITDGNKFNDDGTLRVSAPMKYDTASDGFKKATEKLGIAGHYSSHCMRQTFVNFISSNWDEDNRNAQVACAAVNHSDIRTTVKYYMSVDSRKLKEKWLGLNLGLEAWELYNG